ncbi:DNA repair ATPase [Neisseria sp. Ec49-e6-T10]|uniref:DNA repair ATPase n=1 Tax=Neisseria sp. Ec49-e6-T10 TaxID=3140744 RepID=UPI003EC14250
MKENPTENLGQQELVDKAVAEGGAYEVLNKRLQSQGGRLQELTQDINNQRLNEFGDSFMEVVGRVRIRTEHNCLARDIVRAGDCLLFGYNVFIGLKKETSISDVFSLYRLIENEEGFEAEPAPIEGSFLDDPRFISDFNELYTYYKDTRLLQLLIQNDKLLASFQIGERHTDIRVFRWTLSTDGNSKNIKYIDNRAEQDIALPAPYDFEWVATTREMIIDTGKRLYTNILNTLFVEQKQGVLSIKIENNTADGQQIHAENLEDKNQALIDLRIEYAQLGSLVLLKILPYREQNWRYLVFNKLTQKVVKIDALGLACIQLPEDHGIIFPGGYYLQNGDYKTFDIPMHNMRFKRSHRSPNGEDVLYIFYDPESGASVLLSYDVISRELESPILGHGYARFEDGRMVIFHSEGEEPTRIHPMQIWRTPYFTDEYAARQPTRTGFFGRIGNLELVRGISDLYELCREINNTSVSVQRYTMLCQSVRRLFDAYHWINDPQVEKLPNLLREVSATAEMVLDEYEKVESIQAQSAQALEQAKNKQKSLLSLLVPDSWAQIQEYVNALNDITTQRGSLLTIREYRYMDVAAVDAMEEELLAAQERIADATAKFLASDKALEPITTQLQKLDEAAQAAQTVSILQEPIDQMNNMANDLDMLTSLMGTLQIEDATERTKIVESISEVYAKLNQSKARAQLKRKSLGSNESVAQFGAQFQLFSQSITSALSLAQDPEKCDEQLSRLLVQLEEFESQFGDQEEFLADILSKREEVLETFDAHKQSLLDERQRKAQNVQDAALRILDTIPRRVERLNTPEEVNAFFASDPLILKLRELSGRLRELHDSMRADDVESRLKTARDQAMRSLRDKSELFEEGGNIIKLGPRHRFSVNTQELDLTLLPRDDQLCVHLTGTDYFEPLKNPEIEQLRDYWQISYESETEQLYRAEYLVTQIIVAAKNKEDGLSLDLLKQQIAQFDVLSKTVRDFATPRYKEGYEKGIHDHDATLILTQLLPLSETAGLLRYAPLARALACIYWQYVSSDEEIKLLWIERAKSGRSIAQLFGRNNGIELLEQEVTENMQQWLKEKQLFALVQEDDVSEASAYLVQVLSADRLEINISKYGKQLHDALQSRLQVEHMWTEFELSLQKLVEYPHLQWQQIDNALRGLCQADESLAVLSDYIPEAIAVFLFNGVLPVRFTETDLRFTVSNLMGTHSRIKEQQMVLSVDDLFKRARYHLHKFIPALRRYQALRQNIIAQEREVMHLDEFKPRPLTSFVRNRLINDVYLPVIGDNLAKQMGTVGENKRTDLMGLLMLISPPGYGKTTLMEYVAHRLGLIFMKINGPSLGHRVHSLDPEQAPDATSKQELEKLNLALEMGNNVMLYVDDIQHTSPEFLQKFISLCDGTRRIEGVWKGKTKTYDMRGRRFCVVMAGNPYTESGEVFKIPDMLANRADIYNLGETLGGMQDAFALSYIENALTSNAILAPLATRDMADVYRFVDKAEGKEVSSNEFSYGYSAAEVNEIVGLLERILLVRDIVSQVNQQYIASAAQSDEYRIEPSFKLQGSYRNMNKMVEKMSAIMNDSELKQLVDDHYQGEAQLLTTGAEENLLKLAQIRGTLTEEEAERWTQIKQDFQRHKALGGSDSDTGTKVVAQLYDLVRSFNEFASFVENKPEVEPQHIPWEEMIQSLEKLAKPLPTPNVAVNVTAEAQPAMTSVLNGIAESLDKSFIPVAALMEKKLDVDLRTQRHIVGLTNGFRQLAKMMGQKQVIDVMNDTSNMNDFYGDKK